MESSFSKCFCFLTFLLVISHSVEAITISAEVDGNTLSVSKEVIDTSSFRITFRPIDFKILNSDLGKIYHDNAEFLQATYPISENNFESGLFLIPHISNASEIIPLFGLFELLNNLYREELMRGNFANRVVGIIDKSQLQYLTQRSNALGVSLYPLNQTSVLISSDYNSHAAHEIGHTLSFCDEYSLSDWDRENQFYPGGCKNSFPEECSSTPESCGGNTDIKGFWVGRKKAIETKQKQRIPANQLCRHRLFSKGAMIQRLSKCRGLFGLCSGG